MAKVIVKGQVVGAREFPAKDGRAAQVLLSVQDGERFGMFLDKGHPLAAAKEGQFVEVEGTLSIRKSNGYVNLNINDVERHQLYKLVEVKES